MLKPNRLIPVYYFQVIDNIDAIVKSAKEKFKEDIDSIREDSSKYKDIDPNDLSDDILKEKYDDLKKSYDTLFKKFQVNFHYFNSTTSELESNIDKLISNCQELQRENLSLQNEIKEEKAKMQLASLHVHLDDIPFRITSSHAKFVDTLYREKLMREELTKELDREESLENRSESEPAADIDPNPLLQGDVNQSNTLPDIAIQHDTAEQLTTKS